MTSTILDDYPYCYSIISSGYPSLFSHEERSAFRTVVTAKSNGDEKTFVVENPIYTTSPKCKDFYMDHRHNVAPVSDEGNEVC